ncbi:MAG TPA: DUF1549 and DUF1553 domain-containing protein [Gemmataceae bacterium]|jgi:hypothetical protein|nr:DUF1549 and DUF1553 domain-containing protein [Gemmataceae bacterium]
MCVRSLFVVLVVPALVAAQFPSPEQYDAKIKPKDRAHWAFQPVHAQPVPVVKDAGWVRTPIDAFVVAKLEAKGWKHAPLAEPRAILRRVYLDITGLPPALAEQEAFLSDPSPAALDKLVDDLLGRSAYGERFARHWLDLARYADTNAYERDALKPSVWRFRDYVIRAFNTDKPFDRFVKEQIAGDELSDATEETVIATGFHRLGPWDDEPADAAADRFDQLDDIVSTTSQVFLGLTLACARCHDHKFEPLTMHDYYRMVAVFDPLKRPQFGRADVDDWAAAGSSRKALKDRDLAIFGWKVKNDAARLLGGGAFNLAAAEIDALKKKQPDPVRGYFLLENSPAPPTTHILLRGSPDRPGAKVGPGVPHVVVAKQPEFQSPDAFTTRRRLSLANWIARPDNPLTARVIVNRVWQWHFGHGLVRTESDFGMHGEEPTHPELLDWLAGWFVENGGSIKKLNRLILSSNTYRQASAVKGQGSGVRGQDDGTQQNDPENKLLWRYPYRRLEVEAIRDSVLAVSGRLNREAGGPGVFLPIPKEAIEANSDPKTVWTPSDEKATSRRTIYAVLKRSLTNPLLETLDLCDTARSTARRTTTTVAPQALTLFNGEFVNKQAAFLADRLESEAGVDEVKQIDLAYRLALCRPPTAHEVEQIRAFLKKSGGGRAGREQLGRVLFNLNEFAYPE